MKGLGLLPHGTLAFLAACAGSPSSELPGLSVEEWVVHPLSTEARFVSVRDMTQIGEDLWVLDGAPPFLTRISMATGDAIRFGRRGVGPGEYLAPWAIQPTADSAGIVVWDFGAQKVNKYDLAGNFVGSEVLSQDGRIRARSNFREISYADPFRVRSTSLGYLVGAFERRLDLTADFSRGTLQLSSSSLHGGHDVIGMADLVLPGIEGWKEWAAVPVWDACGEEIAVWTPAASSVLWLTPGGVVFREVRVSLPPHRITKKDITRYLEWMARLEMGSRYRDHGIDLARMAKRIRDRFADMRPAITDLRCQDEGNVWLRLFDTKDDPLGRSNHWVQVGPEGPRRQVRSPAGFSPFLFRHEETLGSYDLPGGEQVIASAPSPPAALSDTR